MRAEASSDIVTVGGGGVSACRLVLTLTNRVVSICNEMDETGQKRMHTGGQFRSGRSRFRSR